MSPFLAYGAVLVGMGGADLLGLIVSILVIAYLLYALVRGERF